MSPLTIQARPVAAAVQFLLTVGAGVAGGAAAGVATGHGLHAGTAVEAGPVGARHGDDLTVLAVEALRAGARVVVLQVLQTKEGNLGRKSNLEIWGNHPLSHCVCIR